MRSDILCLGAAGAGLVLVLLSLVGSPKGAIAVAVVVSLACLAVIARAPLATIGVVLIVLFSFTASWDNVGIGGVKPRLILLVLGIIALWVGYGIRHPLHIPWWLNVYGLTAIIVTVAQFLVPVSQAYLDGRYTTSDAGTSLGTRPGALPSLASVLFNNYAVPAGIVLACMYMPKALRWIVFAYVSGVALSCTAAYLGFIGSPALLHLFLLQAPPVGTRALGFTSHPLHLATSAVMPIALSCWLAVHPKRLFKWTGRVSVIALLLGLYASGSRGGNVAALIALALCAVLLPSVRRRFHTVIAVIATALAGVVLYSPGLMTKILQTTRIVGGETADISDTGRSEVLHQGLSDFSHSPVYGIGPRYISEAHILYVGVLASGGVLLFAAYVLFNVGSIRAAYQSIGIDKALGGALLASLIASLVYWTVADDFHVASVEILYGLVMAVMVRARAEGPAAGPSPADPSATDGGADPGNVDRSMDGARRTAVGSGQAAPRR
jgi:hypothetical protein